MGISYTNNYGARAESYLKAFHGRLTIHIQSEFRRKNKNMLCVVAYIKLDEWKRFYVGGAVVGNGIRYRNTLLGDLDVAYETNLLLIGLITSRCSIGIKPLYGTDGTIRKPIVKVAHKHNLGSDLQLEGGIDRYHPQQMLVFLEPKPIAGCEYNYRRFDQGETASIESVDLSAGGK